MTSRIIAVGNLKGGTGKSTVAVNLACRLAERQSVTLIDADPQGTAAAWLQAGRAEGMPRSRWWRDRSRTRPTPMAGRRRSGRAGGVLAGS